MIDLRGVDIVRMAEDDGVELRSGATRYGPCPKCGGKDRFGVIERPRNGEAQLWHCRQCHEGFADAVEYLRHVRGLVEWRAIFEALRDYGYRDNRSGVRSAQSRPGRSAARQVTREGVRIPAALDQPPPGEWQDAATLFVLDCAKRLATDDGARALRYLLEVRRLTVETIRKHSLGFCAADRSGVVPHEKGRVWRGVTIPVSYGGALWCVNTRRAKGEAKYLAIDGSRRCAPFNGDALADDSIEAVVICEGEFDCMLCDQHAPPGMAAITYGGKDFKPNYEAVTLLRGKRCYCAFDCDENGAGDKGAEAWQSIAKRVRVPFGKDVTEFVQQGGDLSTWLRSIDAADDSEYWSEIMVRYAVQQGGVVRSEV